MDVTHGRQIIMAPQNESDYQHAARQLWPQLNIHGDGPWALVCPVSYSVTLYTFWMAAMNDLTRNHSNWQCRDQHRIVELTPPPRRAPLTIRNRAAMERY
jgi:hypothetical protein